MAEPEPNWRDRIPREERVKVCQHILGKLQEFYSSTPEESLKEKTRSFESNSYSAATSRTDYLRKIANGIGQIENHTKQTQARQAFAVNLAQGNLANHQTQAALRQQLRHHHPEALLRRSQLMDPRQLQQLQSRQAMLQQQTKQQHHARKSSAAVKRPQPSASDPKVGSLLFLVTFHT